MKAIYRNVKPSLEFLKEIHPNEYRMFEMLDRLDELQDIFKEYSTKHFNNMLKDGAVYELETVEQHEQHYLGHGRPLPDYFDTMHSVILDDGAAIEVPKFMMETVVYH